MPKTVARRSAGNASVRIVRLSGKMTAPPSPCSVRAPIRTAGARRECTRSRRHGEEGEAEAEEAAPAEAVTECSGADDPRRDGDVVRVHRPLQVREAHVQRLLDARKSCRDNQRVEAAHEEGGRGQASSTQPRRGPAASALFAFCPFRVVSAFIIVSSSGITGFSSGFCTYDERRTARRTSLGEMSVALRLVRLYGDRHLTPNAKEDDRCSTRY